MNVLNKLWPFKLTEFCYIWHFVNVLLQWTMTIPNSDLWSLPNNDGVIQQWFYLDSGNATTLRNTIQRSLLDNKLLQTVSRLLAEMVQTNALLQTGLQISPHFPIIHKLLALPKLRHYLNFSQGPLEMSSPPPTT